jgi:hypothetical protein
MGALDARGGFVKGQNRIIVVCGRRGGGKTSTVKQAIRYARRLLVLDPHGEYGDTIPNPVTDESELGQFFEEEAGKFDGWACRYVPEYDVEEEAEIFCCRAYEEGSCTIAIDEAEQLMSPNYIPPELARCLRLGRHRDLNIVLVTLRHAELARGATALADAFIVCGAITEPKDLEALAERTDPNFVRTVRELGRYGRLGYDVVERGHFELTPAKVRALFDPHVALARNA